MTKPRKCSCIICREIVLVRTLSAHINLKHIKNCACCGIETTNAKFCSSSCAAKITGTLKPKRSIISRRKTSQTLLILNKLKPKLIKHTKVQKDKIPRIWTRIEYSKLVYNTCKVCSKIFSWSCNRKTCSDECYRKNLSNTAKANPKMGGNKNTRAFGWYDSPIAGKVWLESSYEYRIALELDKHQIKWIRPKGMPYTLNDKHRIYNADFYLIEFDVYLDPKNDYLITQDMTKINAAIKQNSVNIQVLTKHQLTWDEILKVL